MTTSILRCSDGSQNSPRLRLQHSLWSLIGLPMNAPEESSERLHKSAMTTLDGKEFSDRWEQSRVMKKLAEQAWAMSNEH